MNEKNQEITCIVCPLGCKLIVTKSNNKIKKIEGYSCKQGIEYARSEALDPKRMLTSSVAVLHGTWPLVSVKTSLPVPKKDIHTVLSHLKEIQIDAPIQAGDTLVRNIADTDIDIIATKTIQKKTE